MLKIETKEHKYGYDLTVQIEGKGGIVAKQLASALFAIAKENEDGEHLVALALDMYLDMIGVRNDDEDDEDDY